MYYHYIKTTGAYAGASINALDDTRGSTDIAPPHTRAGERAVWTGEAWDIITEGITRRQARQQLVIAGLDEQVEAAIDAISDPMQRKLTRIWYEDASHWERDNAELVALAGSLGLTEQQVDDLFAAAAQI